jgi:hypothetical protein
VSFFRIDAPHDHIADHPFPLGLLLDIFASATR